MLVVYDGPAPSRFKAEGQIWADLFTL
ncbi:hypothetical protein [Candidatus Cyanaurora vandensis]